MTIHIQCFGKLLDLFPRGIQLEYMPQDIAALRALLLTNYPALKEESFSIVVNKKFASAHQALQQEDTLVLLPPFSGG